MPNLKGKVALITGASSGIGAGTAIHFASLGCYVAINGRNVAKLQNTFEECVKAGLPKDKVLMVVGDISVDKDAADIVRKTVHHFGKLDILINNAGLARQTMPIDGVSMADYDAVMGTNVRALYRVTQLAVPHLKKTKGNIVNVSSIAGFRPFAGTSVYCASKASVDHITRAVAVDLAPNGVRVNCVNPGAVKTDFHNNMNTNASEEEKVELMKQMAKFIAKMKVGVPLEIAKPIAFLVSDDASFITGATLVADGGTSLLG